MIKNLVVSSSSEEEVVEASEVSIRTLLVPGIITLQVGSVKTPIAIVELKEMLEEVVKFLKDNNRE